MLLFKIINIIISFSLFLRWLLIILFFIIFDRKYGFKWKKNSWLLDTNIILKLFLVYKSVQNFLVQRGISILFLIIWSSLIISWIFFCAYSSRYYWIYFIYHFLLIFILNFILIVQLMKLFFTKITLLNLNLYFLCTFIFSFHFKISIKFIYIIIKN